MGAIDLPNSSASRLHREELAYPSTEALWREACRMRVLFVGKHPDQYAAVWRKLGLRDVDLVFAAGQRQAERDIEKSLPDGIIVDGGSMGSRRQRMYRALRRAAPQASMILIDSGNPGEPGTQVFDARLQPPIEWQSLADLLKKPRQAEDLVVSGPFTLSLNGRTLAGPFGEERLTPVLCDLMAYFMRHPGEVLTRAVLMREVWKTAYVGDTRTLDVHISWLRGIIEPDSSRPVHILTRRGAGYVFVAGE